MILTLLKREPTIQKLPLSALIALVLTGFISIRFLDLFEGNERSPGVSLLDLSFPVVFGFLAYIAWTIVIAFSARNFAVRVRSAEFEQSLPVTFRHVVLARLSGLWLALFGSFVSASIPILMQAPRILTGTECVMLIARGFVVSGVAAAILGAYRPARLKLTMIESVLVSCASAGAGLLSFWFAPGLLDLIYCVILVGLIVYLWYSLPSTSWAPFPAASKRVVSNGPRTTAPRNAKASFGVRFFGPLRWTIIRSSLLRPRLLGIAAFSWVYAAFPPIGPAMAGWFVALVPWMALNLGLNVIHGIDSLPVRRERILRIVGLTTLAFTMSSMIAFASKDRWNRTYGVIAWGVEVDRVSEETFDAEHHFRLHVKVPAAEWLVAHDPSEAVITAPWGEQVAPTLHPIHSGSSTFIYNPFDVQEDSSGEFLAWQVQRALDEVHGPAAHSEEKFAEWIATIPMDQPISESRIEEASSAHWGYSVVNHSQTPNGPGFAALGAALLWIVVCGFALRPNVPSTKLPAWWSKLPRGLGLVLVIVPLAIAIAHIETSDRTLVPVLIEKAHMWLDAQLGSSPALWALLVLCVSASGYAFLAWRIQRNEVSPLFVHGWRKKALPIY